MFDKFKEKFIKKEDEPEMIFKPLDQTSKEDPEISAPATPPVNGTETRSASVELKVLRPESYEEVGVIADNLLAGCTVFVNMEVLDRATMLRMLDFLNGVTYCTDGEIKRVSATTFIITPHSDVDISDM